MSSSFSLHPATSADIPALAEISGLSFEKDRHTQLKAAHPTQPYNHAAGMVGGFEYWLSLPKGKAELVKAVDNETGHIIGFVCWGSRLDQPQQQQQPPQQTASSVKKPEVVVGSDHVKADAPDLDALAQLKELTSDHLARYMEKVMPPGTRAMYIISIAVRPDQHGHGVGSALVRHGTDRADAEGVFCWVHASEDGAGVFRKCGFEVDETLQIDLDHWAGQMDIKPPGGDEKWGTYTFRYMIRQPRASS